MKEQEQRIAIAKWMGWENIREDGAGMFARHPEKYHGSYRGLPDYTRDLNAMHEAESTLPSTRRGYFNAELFLASTSRNLSSGVKEPEFIFAALHATASQRAEALLRTLNLWTD